jgi:hypothetical protein
MKTAGYSVVQVGDGVFPEMVGDEPIQFTDDRTLVLHVKLSPGPAYALTLNSEKRQGFKSADGTPLAPTVIRLQDERRHGEGRSRPRGEVKPEPAQGEMMASRRNCRRAGR